MTSDAPTEAFVWVWLPDSVEPVIAGRLFEFEDVVAFNYGRSYLGRTEAVPIYLPQLPLTQGAHIPPPGHSIAGAVADAGPDAWGRRVIENRVFGSQTDDGNIPELSALTYLVSTGSDRIGALDFTPSRTEYLEPQPSTSTLDQLLHAAQLVEEGTPLPSELEEALLRGSSVGGARPKALLDAGERKLIAKFSSSSDTYPVVKGEFVAMELARRAGLQVANVELATSLGKDVLLVERFDRTRTTDGWLRRQLVSARTILDLSEFGALDASYVALAEEVRRRFTEPIATLHELFGRLVFNVLCGNTDDHARNHAAFWDGRSMTPLTLTPAYDIDPLPRKGSTASQAMAFAPSGTRTSQVERCVVAASSYALSEREARDIVQKQIETIEREWDSVCDLAGMTPIDRARYWQTAFLNPYALEGFTR